MQTAANEPMKPWWIDAKAWGKLGFDAKVEAARRRRDITLRSGVEVEHDETVDESEMRRAEPLFFEASVGKRETFTIYRGFIIVRTTARFTGRPPERRTVLYIFCRNLEAGQPGTLHINDPGDSVAQAKRRVNYILANKFV